ncbi:hypothetical protein D3C84_199130 [compost metagenome]
MCGCVAVEPLGAAVPHQILAKAVVPVEVGAIPGGIVLVGEGGEGGIFLLAVAQFDGQPVALIQHVGQGQVGGVASQFVVLAARRDRRAAGALGEAVASAVAVDVLPVDPGAKIRRTPAQVGDHVEVAVGVLQVVPALHQTQLETEHALAFCRRQLEGIQRAGMLGRAMHEGVGVAVEVRRRRAAQGKADLVFQRRMEHPEHQVGTTKYREVEVQVGLGDIEVFVVALGGAVDAQVLVETIGLEETRVLAVDRGEVESPVHFLRHRPGERPDAADHVAFRRLLDGQGELVEVEAFVVVEEGLLAHVVAAVVVVDPACLSPAMHLDAVLLLQAIAEGTAKQRATGRVVFCSPDKPGEQQGTDKSSCESKLSRGHGSFLCFY